MPRKAAKIQVRVESVLLKRFHNLVEAKGEKFADAVRWGVMEWVKKNTPSKLKKLQKACENAEKFNKVRGRPVGSKNKKSKKASLKNPAKGKINSKKIKSKIKNKKIKKVKKGLRAPAMAR